MHDPHTVETVIMMCKMVAAHPILGENEDFISPDNEVALYKRLMNDGRAMMARDILVALGVTWQ